MSTHDINPHLAAVSGSQHTCLCMAPCCRDWDARCWCPECACAKATP